MSVAEVADLTKIDPWFIHNMLDIVEMEKRIAAAGDEGTISLDLLRKAKRYGFSDAQIAELTGVDEGGVRRAAHRERRRGGLQAGRHLRGRVRGLHAVLLLDLRDRGREPAGRQAEGPHRRRRPEPHRPGHRVRLLLRARRALAARTRLRHHHGELEPGDGLHRLRHRQPPLLRAAHAGGPAEHHPPRAAGGHHRAARRPDAAEPCRAAGRGRRPHLRHAAVGHPPRRRPQDVQAAHRQAEAAPAAQRHRALLQRGAFHRHTGSAIPCWCGRPTCWAGARWSSPGPRASWSRSSPTRCGPGRGTPS